MKQRLWIGLSILLLVGLMGSLAACSSSEPPNSAKLIEELYAAKLEYVGDASGVSKIMNLVGLIDSHEALGMTLTTDQEPYGITLKFQEASPPNQQELERQAAILLCLITNVDFISYEFTDQAYSYTREQFAEIYGRPLAEYRQSYEQFKEFYNLVYSPSATNHEISLDKLVSQAILKRNAGNYAEGECTAEGHLILGSDTLEEQGGTVVYTLATYGEYGFENGNFTKISGSGVIPTRITFDSQNNLVEYLPASDGSEYEPSIRAMFPAEYQERALQYNESDLQECKEQEHRYAQAYLESIGREAPIGDYADFEHKLPDMKAEVSNQLLEDYADYPYWIGTIEKIENGVRMVYETQWEPSGNGDGKITFRKYNYDSQEVSEENVLEIKAGKLL